MFWRATVMRASVSVVSICYALHCRLFAVCASPSAGQRDTASPSAGQRERQCASKRLLLGGLQLLLLDLQGLCLVGLFLHELRAWLDGFGRSVEIPV